MSSSNGGQNTNTQSITTTVPTVVVSTQGTVSNQPGGIGTLVSGLVQFTPGTGATAVTAKVVMGTSSAGTQVGNTIQVPATAGVPDEIGIEAVDTNLNTVGVYSIVFTQVGASAGASVTYAEIDTVPLTVGNG